MCRKFYFIVYNMCLVTWNIGGDGRFGVFRIGVFGIEAFGIGVMKVVGRELRAIGSVSVFR